MKRIVVSSALAAAFIACLAICSSLASGLVRSSVDQMEITLTFDLSDFQFSRAGGYDYVYGRGMAFIPEAGLPGLPVKAVHVALPQGARVVGLEAKCLNEAVLDGAFEIVPTQPPRVLGASAGAWDGGKEAIYLTDRPYPSEIVEGVHQGFMGDSRILSFRVAPLAWNPVTKALTLRKSILVVARLERAAGPRALRPRPAAAGGFFDAVERTVVNPRDVRRYAESALGEAFASHSALPPGAYQYVVITTATLEPSFAALVEWKTQKGVPATSVTFEWIQANYPGADSREMIRNFIADAYQTWGAVWILLGGDVAQIPSRQVYAMDCEMGDGNDLRCDMYYSDLDGTWNANGVEPYGEVADSVDMYPDVIVGRAPVENVTEAAVFVSKVLTYEKNPPVDYALDMLMAGEVLWDSPFTDAGIGLDMIDEQCVPPRFDPILKLYETLGNESRETVLAAMSAGQNIILHDGHCWYDVMGVGGSYIDRQDADTVSNGERTFILNSIGCWPAAIDKNCIAERFVNNPGGGCIAFIGNSRYGWGSPGNPGFGYSDKLQREFARSLFVDGIFNLGLANADSKAEFVPLAQDENVYRWNEYQVNLLGDPEMPVWTDEPAQIDVEAPDSIASPSTRVRVVASDASGALGGALVCLANGADVYLTGLTDVSGTVEFEVATASAESLVVTVTSPNHRAYQDRIPVASHGRLLVAADVAVVDGGDGKANPGESANLSVSVRNCGGEVAQGVWGVLRSRSGLVQVTDSTVYYGEIGAGSTVSGGSYGVDFSSGCENGDVAGFDLVLTDTLTSRWTVVVNLAVATPIMSVTSYGVGDNLGDGDWIAEPGETVWVEMVISNCGLTGGSATVSTATADPYLAIEDVVTDAGLIESGLEGRSLHRVAVSAECPPAYLGTVEAEITCPGGYAFTDTVHFSVGDLAFSDNCESGEGLWTHTGTPDLWHLSTYRSHSGASSWYFGGDGTHTYPNAAQGALTSGDLIAGEGSVLSFWFWYDFTTYGSDGVYIVVWRNGVADTLDYIGAGGALDIVSRWVQWDSPVEASPGDTLRLTFEFTSDFSQIAEGMYIDDIVLSYAAPGRVEAAGTETGGPGTQIGLSCKAYPNPACDVVLFSFSQPGASATLDIYDVRGRCVAALVKPAGALSLVWNLKGGPGGYVAPGIYLARIRNSGYTLSHKVVVLR